MEYQCKQCGSSDLLWDAITRHNGDDFELVEIFDNCDCQSCGASGAIAQEKKGE
jgi:hypothetical protein